MRVIIRKTYQEMSREAANLVRKRLLQKNNLVLGLATGSTPLGLYQELIRMHREEGLSFKNVHTFNLDEYFGLLPSHPQSYRYFMDANLFNHIDIDKKNTHVPDGTAADIDAFCFQYEEAIRRAGGIDLQVLGIGGDGHIGFNEPGSSLASRTRMVALDEQTISDNARFFERKEDVPRFAITMGVGTVLEAREIILLANGEKKARVIQLALEGPVTSLISATALQFHQRVTVFLDEAAAGALQRTTYYRFSEEAEKRIGREIF